ncbi:MAG: hypothetical protein ACFFB0_21325 [Promethearchaeota archaeon]
MPSNNINKRLEKSINRISIKQGKEQYIKGQVKYLTRHIKAISKFTVEQYFNSFYPVLDYEFLQFNYGGSFDRHTCIKQRYDVDTYLVYREKDSPWYPMIPNRITGSNLFELVRNHLEMFRADYKVDLKILKEFPYTHAIPIRIDFKKQFILLDCIPALLNNDNLMTPNGMDSIKLVNPNMEIELLKELNDMHHGNATKLILLLKYWNIYHNKPLKPYVIERFVENIFTTRNINTWANAVKTFFSNSVHILREGIHIPDYFDPRKSILEDYTYEEIQEFYDAIIKANNYVNDDNW